MGKEVLSFIVERMHESVSAASCSREARASAQTWLGAVGIKSEATTAKTCVAELEADIMPVDSLIGFTEPDMCTQVFGADKAKDAVAHVMELETAGAKYYDCPACAAAKAVLEKKDDILR